MTRECQAFWWCRGEAVATYPPYFGPVRVCRFHVEWAKKYGKPTVSRRAA